MRNANLRLISDDERNKLYNIIQDQLNELHTSTKIYLLKDEGYIVPEIRRMSNNHDIDMRKWVHQFN